MLGAGPLDRRQQLVDRAFPVDPAVAPPPPRASSTRPRRCRPPPARRPRRRPRARRRGSRAPASPSPCPRPRRCRARLAHRFLGRPRRVLLVRRAVAELRRALGGVPERPVERRGVLRGVGEDRDVGVAGARPAPARIAPTWPSIIPLGPTTCTPAVGLGDARSRRSARASRRCRPRRTAVSSPQWPWSVYSSRHRSAITTMASPTSATTSRSASWTMPLRVVRRRAARVLHGRDPEQDHAADAGLHRLDDRLAHRVAGVLHDAGHRRDRLRRRRCPP